MKYKSLFLILWFSIGDLAFAQILINRYVLHHKFELLYGPSALSTVRSEILSRPHIFGGPCSLMEEVLIEKNARPQSLSSLYACVEGFSETRAPLHPSDKLTREVVIQNVCRIMSQNTTSLHYFLSGSHYFTQRLDQIRFLAQKFYPFRVLDEAQLKVLDDEATSLNLISLFDLPWDSRLNLLRNLSFLLCTSKEWQTL